MSIKEAHKAREAEVDSPLSFWQRALVALAMWPGVLLIVFAFPSYFLPMQRYLIWHLFLRS